MGQLMLFTVETTLLGRREITSTLSPALLVCQNAPTGRQGQRGEKQQGGQA
jgi:hypothetical protein